MSQIYDSHGRVAPVTEVAVGSNVVTLIKDKDKDGYKAAQVGFGVAKRPNKSLSGLLEKAKVKSAPALVKEVDFEGELKSGQEIKVEEVFHKGGLVDVVGTSKGKGFAGVIKRHGFHGGPKTHGQSDRHRAPGSIGSGTTPGRVQKGLKMAGHMGNVRVSVFGLEIMEIDKGAGTLLVKGSIPGPSGSIILLKKSKKKKAAYHEPEIQALPNLGGTEQEKGTEGAPVEEKQANTSGEAKTEAVKEQGE